MPLSVANLTTAGSVASLSAFTTASVTPTANALILATVYSTASAGTANAPTITGCNLTWVQIATVLLTATQRLTLLRALGGSPSAGTLSIDFAAQTQFGAEWSIIQWTGTDTSGTNGSGAIVQSVTGTVAASTSASLTLAAFAQATNGTFGAFVQGTTTTHTKGIGYTEMFQTTADGGDTTSTEWRADNDTTVDATSLASAGWAIIGAEIKAADADGGWSLYRPYTIGAAALDVLTGGLFYYWRRRKQEKPDE